MSSSEYERASREIREEGQEAYPGEGYSRIVFANGCFDLLHLGHLQVLFEARRQAGLRGAVVVGLNSDASVRRLKGDGRPVQDEETRATLLVYNRMVDHVIIFDEDTPHELVRALRPHVIVKGGDYAGGAIVGSDLALTVTAPYLDGHSTSSIVGRLRG